MPLPNFRQGMDFRFGATEHESVNTDEINITVNVPPEEGRDGINAATDTIAAFGGGTIELEGGVYGGTENVAIPDNTTVKGTGDTLINGFWFEATGTIGVTESTVVQDHFEVDDEIRITDGAAANWSVGDWIRLEDAAGIDNNDLKGRPKELLKIREVDGSPVGYDIIRTEQPAYNDYTATNVATPAKIVSVAELRNNVTVEGITFNGFYGIELGLSRKIRVRDCTDARLRAITIEGIRNIVAEDIEYTPRIGAFKRIELNGVSRGIFENLDIRYGGDDHMRFYAGAVNVTVRNVDNVGAGSRALWFYRGRNITVEDYRQSDYNFKGTAGGNVEGLQLDFCKHATVQDSQFGMGKGIDQLELRGRGTEDIRVRDCYFEITDKYATSFNIAVNIHCPTNSDEPGVIVEGNTFRNKSVTNLTNYDAVLLDDPNLGNVTIRDNQILTESIDAGTRIRSQFTHYATDPEIVQNLKIIDNYIERGKSGAVTLMWTGDGIVRNVTIAGNTIRGHPTTGSHIITGDIRDIYIRNNTFDANGGVRRIILSSSGGYGEIVNNDLREITNLQADLPAQWRVEGNQGFNTDTSDTATIATGTLSTTVPHQLGLTPSASDIQVTPQTGLGAASEFWVDMVGASSFNINVDVDPGQAVSFSWRATKQQS